MPLCRLPRKAYREWLQDIYIEGGKFSAYLKGKVSKGELAPSVAQFAITALRPAPDHSASCKVNNRQ